MARNLVSTQDLVVWVNEYRWPMAEVERRAGMSRQGIYKRLREAGCLVKRREKGGAPGVMTQVPCGFCGAILTRHVMRLIKGRHLRQFCNATCYMACLQSSGYRESRQGSRLARAIVAQHFTLEPQHVVHHKDGDQRNNDRANLAVFASQREHMAHHRGRIVETVWDGAERKPQ